jgi:hypothetical protein
MRFLGRKRQKKRRSPCGLRRRRGTKGLEGKLSPENQLAASIQFGVLPILELAVSDVVHRGIENIEVIVVCDVLGFGSQDDSATFKFGDLEAFLQSNVSQDPARIRKAVTSDLVI